VKKFIYKFDSLLFTQQQQQQQQQQQNERDAINLNQSNNDIPSCIVH
jgi:hypothetical protein